MKTLFTDAIDAIVASGSCAVPCTLIYGDTKVINCPNCYFDAVGRKSSNKYTPGGPIPFTVGICLYCHGAGTIPSGSPNETINLVPIWDYRDFVGWKGSNDLARYPDGVVQTMSKMSTITKLKRAKEIIINSDIDQYTHHRCTREGEPTPIGFGNDAYIITNWRHQQ